MTQSAAPKRTYTPRANIPAAWAMPAEKTAAAKLPVHSWVPTIVAALVAVVALVAGAMRVASWYQRQAAAPVVAASPPKPPPSPVVAPVAVSKLPVPIEPVAHEPLELPAHTKAKRLVDASMEHLKKKEYDKARPIAERAAALDPTFPEAWRAVGVVRAELGDAKGARISYQKYIALAPDAPDAPDVRRILGQ